MKQLLFKQSEKCEGKEVQYPGSPAEMKGLSGIFSLSVILLPTLHDYYNFN
jgi:hypothetical protein